MKVVFIRGRDRDEARKKAVDYWLSHRDQFSCTMQDFLRKCATDPSGRVILYKE